MKRTGGMAQVVEGLPSKHKALNSISSSTKRERKTERERERERERENMDIFIQRNTG
jgi:hypothetical protein